MAIAQENIMTTHPERGMDVSRSSFVVIHFAGTRTFPCTCLFVFLYRKKKDLDLDTTTDAGRLNKQKGTAKFDGKERVVGG